MKTKTIANPVVVAPVGVVAAVVVVGVAMKIATPNPKSLKLKTL